MAILGEEGNKLVSVLFLACGDVNTILDFDNSFSRLSEMTVHTPTQKIENMQTVWFATKTQEVMVAKLEIKFKVDITSDAFIWFFNKSGGNLETSFESR